MYNINSRCGGSRCGFNPRLQNSGNKAHGHQRMKCQSKPPLSEKNQKFFKKQIVDYVVSAEVFRSTPHATIYARDNLARLLSYDFNHLSKSKRNPSNQHLERQTPAYTPEQERPRYLGPAKTQEERQKSGHRITTQVSARKLFSAAT